MGAGIGFGKAGNNPYQWLALGGAGLQSMLAGSPTNDPQSLQNDQFLRAAAASGQPQTSIPRDVHGLLPMLAQRIGLISPTVQASPDQMNMEKIYLAAKKQADDARTMSEMIKFIGVVNSSMKYGPEFASKVYSAFPSLETPGITPRDIAGLTIPQETAEQRKADAEQVREDQRQQQIDIQNRRADLTERHLTDIENKGDKSNAANRRFAFTMYINSLKNRKDIAGNLDPTAVKAIDNANKVFNSGGDVTDAMRMNESLFNPPQSPTPTDTSDSLLHNLGRLISNPRTALFGASPAIGAPTNVQPQAQPTVVPAKIVPSWVKH